MKPSSKLVCWHNALCHGQWQWAESISLGRSQHLATSGMTQRYCCCYFCWWCWRQLWCKWASDRSLSLSLSLSPFVTEHVMDRSHALALNTPRKEAQLIMFECHPKCVCVCVCTVHTDRMESWTLHLHWLTGAAAALQQCLQSLGTNGETLISPLAQSFRRCYGVGVFAC